MRTTVALTALAAAVLTLTSLQMASGFTVWSAAGITVVIVLGVWIWSRLEAHAGESRRSREFNALRSRMFDVVRRGRAVADRYEETGMGPEAAAARLIADELDAELT